MTRRPTSPRRGLVIIAVLVIVGAALLVVTGLLFLIQADVAGAAGARDAAQSRALVRSGLLVIQQELDGQRDRILDGELPELPEEFLLYEAPGDHRGVVRLLPVTPDGRRLGPEAARLDLNTVDAAALGATGLIAPELAGRVIAYRDARGGAIQSVAELLEVDGMTAEVLYGPLDGIRVLGDGEVEDFGEEATPRGLADVVTVYGFEPALQRSGRLRINFNVEWSDDLERRVAERFGQEVAQAVAQLFASGVRFEDEGAIIDVLRQFDVDPEDWVEAVDAITSEAGDVHFGRVDLNVAPVEVLQALPGMTPEDAAALVGARDGLSADERATVLWPLLTETITEEQCQALAGRVTNRSWTYRIRFAAGEVVGEDGDGDLQQPRIYEAVIDLSAPAARIAYLRDITLLELTARLASQAPAGSEDAFDDGDALGPEVEEDPSISPDPAPDPVEDGRGDADDPMSPETGMMTDGGADASTPRRRVGRWQPG